MLTWKHLQRHQALLYALSQAKTANDVKLLITQAKYHQLRTLLLLVASIYLLRLPISDRLRQQLIRARKRKLLRTYFNSWAQVRRLLQTKDRQRWRQVLLEAASLLIPCAKAVFANQNG